MCNFLFRILIVGIFVINGVSVDSVFYISDMECFFECFEKIILFHCSSWNREKLNFSVIC